MGGTGRIAVALGLLAAMLLLGWAATPRPDPLHEVLAIGPDAVVVLGGGGGERLDLGVILVEELGVPLVLAGDALGEGRVLGLVCDERVLCVPATDTAGEAAGTAALASARGWRSVAVVTSDFHVNRSRTVFAQCLEGRRVLVAGAPATAALPSRVLRSGRELVAHLAAWTVRRAC